MSDAASHPQPLNYLAPPRGRSSWVIVILCVYFTLIGGGVISVSLLVWGESASTWGLFLATIAVLLTCEAGLLLVPVRKVRGRAVTKRSLWFPLIASGLLAGLLVLGGGWALAEYAKSQSGMWVAVVAAGAMWVAWAIVFFVIARRTSPQDVGGRLHRFLLAGSVLELLVAVPTHLVVRRRTECCAGIYTGFGIACGVAVMLLAFGPSVCVLYLRRWRDVQAPARPARKVLAVDQ